jgi:alpha-beta hydrolase superfamily lysophospholipase
LLCKDAKICQKCQLLILKLLLFLNVKNIEKALLWLLGIGMILYIGICGFFYFYQEHLIFPGRVVSAGYHYNFALPYKQYAIKTADGNIVDGYLFKAANPKGLIFYLHGNGGNVESWNKAIPKYIALGYDAFTFDYPGYGKSTGRLTSLNQLFTAIQTAYDTMKRAYPEQHIIIMGYSLGSGGGAWLAANNHPEKLILLAPYYSLGDMALKRYPFLPVVILKYPINTYQYISHVSAPVTIFHGDRDEVIYYGSSIKLTPYLKRTDTLITLKGQNHEDFDDNAVYMKDLAAILK